MSSCSYCQAIIEDEEWETEDGQIFCSASCIAETRLRELREAMPTDLVLAEAKQMQMRDCPICGRHCQVDGQRHHYVYSFFLFSKWGSEDFEACTRCGLFTKAWTMLKCLLMGWWAVPFGLPLTIIQVVRNLAEIRSAPKWQPPSETLQKAARNRLAKEWAKAEIQAQDAPH